MCVCYFLCLCADVLDPFCHSLRKAWSMHSFAICSSSFSCQRSDCVRLDRAHKTQASGALWTWPGMCVCLGLPPCVRPHAELVGPGPAGRGPAVNLDVADSLRSAVRQSAPRCQHPCARRVGRPSWLEVWNRQQVAFVAAWIRICGPSRTWGPRDCHATTGPE